MRRLAPSLIALLVISLTAVFLAKWLGWLDLPALLDVAVGGAGLVGLVLLVKLPWDLYMRARALVADQGDARERMIEVAEEEGRYARRTARRLLWVCLGLHVASAAVVFAATWASGGRLGYWFAAFYLLSTLFRPAVALYEHIGRRLRELQHRTRYPREDVVSLRERLEVIEESLDFDQLTSRDDHEELAAALERASKRVDTMDREHRARTAGFEDQVDLCLRELERTVDKLTDDRELLAGIRAFVKVVKET